MKAKKNFMAIDQYGQTYHNLGNHPRKSLINRLYCKHVSKMYCNKADGSYNHVGYVVGSLWCTLYEVKPFEGK